MKKMLEDAAAAANMLTPAGSTKWGGQENGGKQSMAPGVPTGPGEDLKTAGIFPGLMMPVDTDGQQVGPSSGPVTQGPGAQATPDIEQGTQGLGAQGDLQRGLTMDQGRKDLKDYLKQK